MASTQGYSSSIPPGSRQSHVQFGPDQVKIFERDEEEEDVTPRTQARIDQATQNKAANVSALANGAASARAARSPNIDELQAEIGFLKKRITLLEKDLVEEDTEASLAATNKAITRNDVVANEREIQNQHELIYALERELESRRVESVRTVLHIYDEAEPQPVPRLQPVRVFQIDYAAAAKMERQVNPRDNEAETGDARLRGPNGAELRFRRYFLP